MPELQTELTARKETAWQVHGNKSRLFNWLTGLNAFAGVCAGATAAGFISNFFGVDVLWITVLAGSVSALASVFLPMLKVSATRAAEAAGRVEELSFAVKGGLDDKEAYRQLGAIVTGFSEIIGGPIA